MVAAMTQTGSPAWLVVGWIALATAAACGLGITWDIVVAGHRQQMAIMNLVWPITALYWGPVAVWFYVRRGRQGHDAEGDRDDEPPSFWRFARKNWWPISKGVSHCGAGCTLGDIVGEWVVYLTAWTIPLFASEAANSLIAMFVADWPRPRPTRCRSWRSRSACSVSWRSTTWSSGSRR
jgi:hypothetical protein